MTPAFARSALNKGIQMNEVKRYGNTWCEVTERTVFKHDQQDGDYVKLSDYTSLQEQLTATTNSLTNAQEALKSAGIEADTVQAGVMELVSRMNQVVAENALMLTDYRDIPEMRRIGAPLTPATEACLDAVRADAVEDVAKRLYGQGYNFEVLTRFAAQLRGKK